MTKVFFLIFCLLTYVASNGQLRHKGFEKIDGYVATVAAQSPQELAVKLTSPFGTELEKARAIFSWITQHIAYNTGIFASIKKQYASRFEFDPLDTIANWSSGEEMSAIRVLHRRVTVCEGYARLFKVLCSYAGLKAEVVTGFARPNATRPSKFRSNHSWNAVRIDSVWHLVDATWGSGYVDHREEFVQQINEAYFLPSPSSFIRDHYPENLRWTLMENTPPVSEFRQSPFRYKCFDKYSILPASLGSGFIHAEPGDTIAIELEVKNMDKDRQIGSDPFFDSTELNQMPYSVFLYPQINGTKVLYSYIVTSSKVKWLHLFYNDDLVLRYHLMVDNK